MFPNIVNLIHSFPDAIIAGTMVAAVCSFLGTFVIMKRMVFIGIALSEVAAAGVALGIFAGINPFLISTILTLATVCLLAFPFETTRIPRDAITGIVFILASGLSILFVSKSAFGLEEVKNLLHGDLILVRHIDLQTVFLLLPVLACAILFFRPTLYTFLDRESARVMDIKVTFWEFLYFFLLGITISIVTRIAGLILVFCYLVVAPVGALLIARRLWVVLVVSVISAIICTLLGLYFSFAYDLPTNQVIAVASCGWVGIAALAGFIRKS